MAAVLLAVVAFAVAASMPGKPGKEKAEREDARRMHCLAARNRPRLVETAIVLRLAEPGSTETGFRPLKGDRRSTTLGRWSDRDRKGFDRACTTLATLSAPKGVLEPPPGPPWWARIWGNPVFTLVLGALLTLITGRFLAHVTRRDTMADEFARAANAYVAAAETVFGQRRDKQVAELGLLESRRADLRAGILRSRPAGPEGERLRLALDEAHAALTERWSKPESADSARDSLESLTGALEAALGGKSAGAQSGGRP